MTHDAPVRVLVVDDSAFMRRAIATMLKSDPQIDVVAIGHNGQDAVDLAQQHKPDVITLDIEMPVMDGLTALRHIMRQSPTQVLMLSSLTTQGSDASLKALKLGAADVLAKDHANFSLNIVNTLQDKVIERVKQLGMARARRFGAPVVKKSVPTSLPSYRSTQFDVVCIGSSTGGPPVLETILSAVPGAFNLPIVVAQHMPEVFTKSMAGRLESMCALPVTHIKDGDVLERGTIHIAPGGQHIHIKKTGLGRMMLHTSQEPVTDLFKPSVNALFETAATCFGSRVLAIVLTGIGEDGKRGATALKQANAHVLAQDEQTCVVYGMPKAVAQANLIDAALCPQDLAKVLMSLAPAAAAA